VRETKSTSKSSIPTGWRRGVLSDYIAKKAKGIVPHKTPNARFELYSVPSHETGRPEIVSGSDIGSNKQIVDVGTVLLCKINPRINRSWVVSSHTGHQKIASTEWISFPPSDDFEPKYLAYYLNQESLRSFLAANASGVGGSLTRVKPSTIKEYPYPIAPIEQQRQIVAEIEKQFSRLDESVASLNRVRANLKRYKAAVLKAAIEGRLTEEWRKQNPDVEPASTLLERILAERRAKWEEAEFAKMRAKGKEPKDDTWKKKYRKAFDLDEKSQRALAPGWAWVSIEAILKTPEALSYGILKPGPFVTSGIPMVRVVDVGDGVIIPTEIVQVTEESAAPYERTRLENGDILLAVMATIGRAPGGHPNSPSCGHLKIPHL
jgi:type I restriction enzyme S subunit